jgi:hypothetical protein
MKLITFCTKCVNVISDTDNPDRLKFAWFVVPFTDDNILEFTCSEGHKNALYLNNYKFTVLFEVGIFAITDSYYREAVSSFTAALERFYEFYIQLVMEKFKVEAEIFAKGWKEMRNQSERQLGAFISAYMIQNGKMPPLLKQKDVEFRNSVVHKGTIPTKEDAINFGNAVLNIINTILTEIHRDLDYEQRALFEKRSEGLVKIAEQKNITAQTNLGSVIAEHYSESKEVATTIDKHLEEIERLRRYQDRIKYSNFRK